MSLQVAQRPAYDPDDLEKHFKPKIRTGGVLQPSSFFNHPLLNVRPTHITDALADQCADGYVGKATAGLNHKYRASGAEVRKAFQECRFKGRVLIALDWAFPGMREAQMVHFMATSGLSIKEIAEGFRSLFGDYALEYANHINQLAADVLRPPQACTSEPWLLPGHVSLILGFNDLRSGMAPARLLAAQPGDPIRTDLPAKDLVVISLGKLHYHLHPDDLRRASAVSSGA